jgi:hypothetical protein
VPLADNTYACFAFPVPFTVDEQAVAWGPVIDDARVVHHWILYDAKSTTKPVGCGGAGRVFLMGWAPGAPSWVLPSDVGLELANPGGWLVLEVHYNNVAKLPDARDRSGVAVCTTKQKRPKEAGMIAFGSARFIIPAEEAPYDVVGRCPPMATATLKAPLHVLGVWPHMHMLGVSLKTALISGGTTRLLADVPQWDFNSQTGYPRDPDRWIIKPGDDVLTTCTYRNTTGAAVRFGERTKDEMCLNFAMVYPIAAAAALDTVPLRLCAL